VVAPNIRTSGTPINLQPACYRRFVVALAMFEYADLPPAL
jgi:hypothetical protein